jgi:hypothetical protein
VKRGRSIAIAGAALLAAGAAGCTPGPVDVATLAPNSLATELVGHWTFDETAGATAHDSSGNQRDGAIASGGGFGPGWSWAPGHFAGGLHVSGIDQVTVGSPPFPQATASYSVAAWLMIQYGDVDPPLATLLSIETGFGGGWSMNVAPPPPPPGGGGSYRFAYPIGPYPQDYVFVECDCFAWNAWTHIAAVLDATTSTLTLYVNGVESSHATAPAGISPHQGTLFIGRWPGPGRNLAGTLDDVAIYSRALVPEEVALLASAPAPIPK